MNRYITSTININFARSTEAILQQPFLTDHLKLFREVIILF